MNVMKLDDGALRSAVGGRVYAAGDDGYHAARTPWQRNSDPHPALVVEATGPQDIQTALRFARANAVPFSVQAAGHGQVAPAEGGVLVRTTKLTAVEIDAGRRTARVGAGTPWSDVIAAAAPHGLAPLSGTSSAVSVAGYTLGGGTGWLSRAHGYAADSVLSVDVVTADGERVTATEAQHPDLFWAVRGGSGNFGVVTALEFRLYPVGTVYAGMAMFSADRAADAFAAYREWALDEPDESNTAIMVAQMPPVPEVPEPIRGRRVLMLRAFHLGDAAAAERSLAPLRDVTGPPLLDGMRETTFADAAAMLPSPPPMVSEMYFGLFDDIPQAAIDAAVEAEGASGVELRHWGGAMARPEPGAGPIGHREMPFSIVVAAQAPDRDQADRLKATVDAVGARLAPYAAAGKSFLNFLGDAGQTEKAYTPADYRRLREVKAAYDPANVFAANHNIPPA